MIIIVWKSWSWKTTLSNELQESFGYEIPFNVTTRKPREKDDSDYSEYRFVSEEYFDFLKRNSLLLNSTTFNQNSYWTTGIYKEKTVFVVDQKWREDLLKIYPTAQTVWVEVNSLIRRTRLYERGLRDEALEERVNWASEDMSASPSCFIFNWTQNIKEGALKLIWIINEK